MKVNRTSMLTGIEHTLELPVTPEQMLAYEQDALVQDAFPHLRPADREFILTGVTAEEWATGMSLPQNEPPA